MRTPTIAEGNAHIGFITRWWRNWKRHYAATRELDACGDSEVAHLAHDLGVSASELRTLAGRWPDSADLLRRRMDALGVDATQVGRLEPEVMRDLQRVCGQCADEKRCEHDLRRDAGDASWRTYCPNVETLDAVRSQERDRRWRRGDRKWRPF
jgi:hypothetical protein